jgi:hypothetical protein
LGYVPIPPTDRAPKLALRWLIESLVWSLLSESSGAGRRRRLHFCHTPKHGSWLNIAENELSSLTRQCVSGRRFSRLATLQSELAAWSTDVNTTQRGVDWQMKILDARGKLKSLYPKIKL